MSADTGHATIGAWRWPLFAACLLLGLLAVRNAANALYAQDRPALAAKFVPADGTSLASLALDRVTAAGGTVDATSMALARRALRKAPRAALPLVVTGLEASARGDPARAQASMEAARARQPRTEAARFWLLDHDMRTGRFAAGLDEIAPAMALRAGTTTALMNLVGGLATSPEGRRAVLEKLARQPVWRAQFFEQEAGAALPPGTILALLEALPPAGDPRAAQAEQAAVIKALVARGDYATAYGAWRSFLPPRERPTAGQVYDPDFRGLPGAEPFAWSLQPQSDLSVARMGGAADGRAGRLVVDYRATVPRTIVSEIVPVPPAAYGLTIEARGTGAPADVARIDASVTCLPDGRLLASVPLAPLPAPFRIFRTDLIVPAACPFVRIALSGEPGASFEAVSAEIAAIRLTRRP